jgi:site-specific DNA-cytosine methylase
MKVLELFSGTESFSKVARERGHETFTVDYDPEFDPDLCMDILDVTVDKIPFKPDIVWASPPCTSFSVASIYRHWKDGYPKSPQAFIGLAIVCKTKQLIKELNPTFWIIENPRGMLRKQRLMEELKRNTVTYCQYGSLIQKPTDLWNNLEGWKPLPMCRPGSPCHEKASRCARKGLQGINNSFSNLGSKGKVKRAIVPKELCEEIIMFCEGKIKEEGGF